MYLCTLYNSGTPTYSEVTDPATCTGYITEAASNFGPALTYNDANAIIGGVALLFAVAFTFRQLLIFLLNR